MAMASFGSDQQKGQIDRCESVPFDPVQSPSVWEKTYDYNFDCGMNVAWTMTIHDQASDFDLGWGHDSG